MSFSSILRGIFPFLLNPMAPGNMKSEFVGLQRNKIVSKGALSRKALARIGENGNELASSVNMEGLNGGALGHTTTAASNPKSPPVTTVGDGGDDHTGTKSPGLAADQDGEGKALDAHEVQHLKALSMLHLDVIEQQQQELQRRDQELQKVRAQNDTSFIKINQIAKAHREEKPSLKARLERIQRRTVLAQKHQEPLFNHLHIPAQVSSADSTLTCKRKSSCEPTTPVKRQQTEKDATPSKSPTPSPASTPTSSRRKQLKLHTKERSRTKEEKSARTRNERSDRSRAKEDRTDKKEERTPRKEGQGSKVKEEKKSNGEAEKSAVKGEQYFKTEVIYPCLSDLRVTDPDPALPEGQTVVQVPSWRVNIVHSSTSTESVEDIEDSTFERRHQKYEVAEQKRKRWDIQRVRELREHERLEQKMLRREYGNWDDVLKTFYPEPSDACELQVSETVPLVAFGVQVPTAKEGEFELPWYDVNERDKEESRRQTRSRTNRR